MAANGTSMLCRACVRNSFWSQSCLSHFQVTFTCYKYFSNLTCIIQNPILSWCYSIFSFAHNRITLLALVLMPCSLPFEANGKSPIDSAEQWTRPAKLQLFGQFLPSFTVSFSEGISRAVDLQQSTWALGVAPSQMPRASNRSLHPAVGNSRQSKMTDGAQYRQSVWQLCYILPKNSEQNFSQLKSYLQPLGFFFPARIE